MTSDTENEFLSVKTWGKPLPRHMPYRSFKIHIDLAFWKKDELIVKVDFENGKTVGTLKEMQVASSLTLTYSGSSSS